MRLDPAVKGEGVYCFDLAVPVRNVVATSQINPSAIGTGDYAIISARALMPGLSDCPAPYNDATVSMILVEQDGTPPTQFSTAFYAAFNN
jgi:hypothetical protein